MDKSSCHCCVFHTKPNSQYFFVVIIRHCGWWLGRWRYQSIVQKIIVEMTHIEMRFFMSGITDNENHWHYDPDVTDILCKGMCMWMSHYCRRNLTVILCPSNFVI